MKSNPAQALHDPLIYVRSPGHPAQQLSHRHHRVLDQIPPERPFPPGDNGRRLRQCQRQIRQFRRDRVGTSRYDWPENTAARRPGGAKAPETAGPDGWGLGSVGKAG